MNKMIYTKSAIPFMMSSCSLIILWSLGVIRNDFYIPLNGDGLLFYSLYIFWLDSKNDAKSNS